MESIREQVKAINDKLEEFRKEFEHIEQEKNDLNQKCNVDKIKIEKKYRPEICRLEALKEGLVCFYNVIQNYTQKKIVDYCLRKCELDLPKLYKMLDDLDKSRYDKDKAHRIADKMVDLINSNITYIEGELTRVKIRRNDEYPHNNNNLASVLKKIKDLQARFESYISGDEVKNLNESLQSIYSDYEVTNDYFSMFDEPDQYRQMKSEMLLGIKKIPVAVPDFACEKMKECLSDYFDEKAKTIAWPVVFKTDSFEEITVEYTDKNESCLKGGIQALILNFLRCFNAGFKVSLFDYVHYNADIFGPLAVFAKERNSFIENVAQDENGLKESISVLADYYRNKVGSKIGTQSVYDYNREHEDDERIPLRMLIINKNKELSLLSVESDISYLVNNAEKFGITVVRLFQISDGKEKGTDSEHSNYSDNSKREKIVSDAAGNFYIESGKERVPFEWPTSPKTIPESFIAKFKSSKTETRYFKRYEMHLPEKSIGKRKPIILPFAVDDENNAISCKFDENENFAAYLMGTSGSGKSTLLHTLIAGILMNYHPDEVELWLLDFKMTEFRRYVDCCPPHVKYILLEKSEELVFDAIDALTKIVNDRKHLFSKNHWEKLTDVPLDKNMPAIFIIIDEFAQMSQIIRDTKISGRADYTLKLENLLTQGRAFGLKFIFASQTYTTGVAGLTETAKKQIQMRFAMKNETIEIKETLNISSNENTPEIQEYISSLPPRQTLFKSRDESGKIKIDKYFNMYTENGEIETLIKKIDAVMKPLPEGSVTDNSTYIEKNSVAIDGSQPKTYESQMEYYKDFEAKSDSDDIDSGDVFIYPGVPCSFNLVRPFVLCNGTYENILLTGGKREEKVSVLMSILKSYEKTGNNVEIWAHERTSAFRKYKNRFDNSKKISDLAEICGRISKIKSDIQAREVAPGLIVCMGYELIASDFEIFGGGDFISVPKPKPVGENKSKIPTVSEILERVKQCPDPDEKKRIMAEYNEAVKKESESGDASRQVEEETETFSIYDARNDLEWILKNGSFFGLHFLFYFEQGCDFVNLKMRSQVFKHKILFSMSKDDAAEIGCKKAAGIDSGMFVYSNGKDVYTMRPHIFKGVPLNGWNVDDNGVVVHEKL